MSKLSDLAPSVFSANEGQPHHLLFLGCKSPVCRTHRNRCPTWQPLENIPAVLYVKNLETCSLKKNKEPALCCFLKWASFISVYLTFRSVLLWVGLRSAFSPTFPNCPPWSPGATELSYYNGDEWEASGEKRQEGEQLSWRPKHQLSSTPSCSLIPQLHTSRLFFKLSKSGIIVRTFLWIYRPVICFCFHADRAGLFSHGYFPNCLQKKRTLNLITSHLVLSVCAVTWSITSPH